MIVKRPFFLNGTHGSMCTLPSGRYDAPYAHKKTKKASFGFSMMNMIKTVHIYVLATHPIPCESSFTVIDLLSLEAC